MVRRRGDQRGLTTLLFTDIVGSSEVAVELGDRRWRHLQGRHHAEVRKQLRHFGGREIDTAGDGFFATFGSPAAGARCAFAIVRQVRELGLDIRAGLHIGEAELAGEKVGGIAVTTAQRVESAAGPGQVLVTDTIVHLVAGSGLEFTDLGSRELKGVPGRWELFSLDVVDGDSIGSPLGPEQAAEYRLRASPAVEAPPRRRFVWRASLALAALLVAVVILVSRRQPSEQPQAPSAGSDVHQTSAVLNDSGTVLFRPLGVGSSVQSGAVGTGGPIVLTAPIGRANQAFAWIFSGEPASGGGHQQLQELNQAGGAIGATFPHLDSCVTPPGCLAELDGKVWFLVPPKGAGPYSKGVFAQGIDVITGKRETPLPVRRDISLSGDVRGMAAGDDALWVGDTVDSTVDDLDLGTGRVKRYAIEGSVDDLVFGGGYLWVIDGTIGTLTRLDPTDGERKEFPLDTAGTLSSLGVGGGYVWITDDTLGALWRVSTDLSSVTSITVGARPDDVVYAHGTVWVANYGDDTVSKVDPGLAQETASYPVGIQPRALAAANGTVWIVGDLPGSNTS